MVDKIDIDALLEKNPAARDAFEKNRKLVPVASRKHDGHASGSPYKKRQVRPDDSRTDEDADRRLGYSRV